MFKRPDPPPDSQKQGLFEGQLRHPDTRIPKRSLPDQITLGLTHKDEGVVSTDFGGRRDPLPDIKRRESEALF